MCRTVSIKLRSAYVNLSHNCYVDRSARGCSLAPESLSNSNSQARSRAFTRSLPKLPPKSAIRRAGGHPVIHGRPVIDADSHKCENPVVFFDYVAAPYRGRIRFMRDRFGEQRFRILDRARTGAASSSASSCSPRATAKGRPPVPRRDHDRRSVQSRAHRAHGPRERRSPGDLRLGRAGLQLAGRSQSSRPRSAAPTTTTSARTARRSGAAAPGRRAAAAGPGRGGAGAAPLRGRARHAGRHLLAEPAAPHPAAPDRFPDDARAASTSRIRTSSRSSPRRERHDVAIGIHGAPGFQLAGGSLGPARQLHAGPRVRQSHHAADGAREADLRRRDGAPSRAALRLPRGRLRLAARLDAQPARALARSAIRDFDPRLEPRPREFLLEFARERRAGGLRCCARRASCCGMLFTRRRGEARPARSSSASAPSTRCCRDPLEYLERGQIFLTVEPDDPAPGYLRAALGGVGRRVCGHRDRLRPLGRDAARLRRAGRASTPRSTPTTRRSCSRAMRCGSTVRRSCGASARRSRDCADCLEQIAGDRDGHRDTLDPLRVLSPEERNVAPGRLSALPTRARRRGRPRGAHAREARGALSRARSQAGPLARGDR